MKNKQDLLGLFAQHRVAGNLLMCLMILGGLYALGQLNRQFFPTFKLDMIEVRVKWTGASAEDVESSITLPLEQVLRNVNNLRKMTSSSSQGMSSIRLELKEGTDNQTALIEALNEVKVKIDEFRNLPGDAEEPQVFNIIKYEPVASLLISGSNNLDDLRKLAHQFKRSLLARGISNIEIVGLPEEEISIEVPTGILESLDVTLDQLGDRINALSEDGTWGLIGRNDRAQGLRSFEQRRSAIEFENITVLGDSLQRVRLADIATIKRQSRPDEVFLSRNGAPIVEMKIRNSENSDVLKSAAILDRWLEDTKDRLPPNIRIETYRESWVLIQERIHLMLENGLSGLILVIAILYLFLSARLAWWVAAGIPVSFFATLYFLYLSGGSINMISLLGLIIAFGIIVDDAIVVGEDALAHYQAGETPLLAAEKGARRMFPPVVASSLTTIAAFLPLMMIGGPAGAILFDVPLVIIVVITASVIESFLILPSHLRYAFVKLEKPSETGFRARFERRFNHFRDFTFRTIIEHALTHRGLSISIVVAGFIVTIGFLASGRLPFVFFLSPEPQTLYVNVRFNPGTPRKTVDEFMATLEDTLQQTDARLSDEKLITNHVVMHGGDITNEGVQERRGSHLASMVLELAPPDRREIRNNQLVEAWEANIQFPAGIDQFSVIEPSTGPPGRDIVLRLKHGDAPVLKKAAEKLIQALRNIQGLSSIEDNLPYGREQIVWRLNPTGEALNLTINELGRQMRASFEGHLVQIFQVGPEELEARIRLPESQTRDLSILEKLMIRTPNGERVPLETLAERDTQRGFEVLRHADGEIAVDVLADVDTSVANANDILEHLELEFLPALALEYGIDYSLEGQSAEQKETGKDMFQGLIIGLILIYLILAWVFSSYGWPIMVMSVIPFGLIGAIIGHIVMGIDMTILSFLGFFGLSGIVVNDSIILIISYKELKEQGNSTYDALIACTQQRLRPVILTSVTTIAGLTPLLFERSLQAQFLIPVAVSIAFGLAFATALVLIIVPVLLSFYEDFYANRRHRRETG